MEWSKNKKYKKNSKPGLCPGCPGSGEKEKGEDKEGTVSEEKVIASELVSLANHIRQAAWLQVTAATINCTWQRHQVSSGGAETQQSKSSASGQEKKCRRPERHSDIFL